MSKLQGLEVKLKTKASKLPDTPGVYKFLNAKNQILYIGKATSLRSRVKSYFSKNLNEKRSPLIAKMILEAKNIKFEKTDSVLEALILEATLIKKHQPPYNTAEKDQKSFNYVVITAEKFPRVLVVRERELKTENLKLKIREAFGPYPHTSELKSALKIIRKIFPFRDRCNLGQNKPCFNYQLNLCPGTCIGVISEKEYAKTIHHIKLFFSGKKKKLITDLEKEMKSLAKAREFERAIEIKKKIFALQHIQDISLLKSENLTTKYLLPTTRIEAYDIAHISGTDMVGVMVVVENGEANKSDYRKFKIRGQKNADDTRALKEILERRFKHTEWPFPDLIVVDGGVAQLNTAESVIDHYKLNVAIVAVVKDATHKAREILNTKPENRNKYENQILLANSEAHRFAIKFHRHLRDRLPK